MCNKEVLQRLRKERALNQPPVSHDQINEWLSLYKSTGLQQYLNRIVTGMYSLQVACALRYASEGNLGDLIQEASIGMIKAVRDYTTTKAPHFAPYAKRCCNNAIIDSLRNDSRLMRIPKEIQSKIKDVHREAEALAHELEREYFTPDMVCEDTTAGKRIAAGLTDSTQRTSDPASSPHTTSQPDHDRRTIANAMLNLAPGQRQIITMYYSSEEKDYRKQLRAFKIPHEHAHRIHEEGLNRLRQALNVPPAG